MRKKIKKVLALILCLSTLTACGLWIPSMCGLVFAGEQAEAGTIKNTKETISSSNIFRKLYACVRKAESLLKEDKRKGGSETGDLITNWYTHCRTRKENFVYSPYSLRDCIRILYPAARGESKAQIEAVLGLDAVSLEKYKEMDARALFQDGIGLKVANKAYINANLIADSSSVHPELLDTQTLDLIAFDSDSYRKINGYVAEQTEQKIKNLLSDSDITEDTMSVLINCLYFKNSWNHEDAVLTWTDGGAYKGFHDECALTEIKEDGNIDILRLPYGNYPWQEDQWGPYPGEIVEGMHEYAMYIICDNTESVSENVDDYLAGKSGKELLELLDFRDYAGLQGYTDADFRIPVFELRCKDSLKEMLRSFGMEAPFEAKSGDFDELAKGMYISEILQESYVRADQNGTEAAAATAAVMAVGAMFMEPEQQVWKHVMADNAFAFFIKDDSVNEVLFAGRVGSLLEAGEKA